MDKFRIEGGHRLSGKVRVSGAKNAALPCLAASLLTAEPVVLSNLPRVRDILTMEKVLEVLGESCRNDAGKTTIVVGSRSTDNAPYELVRTMRASVLVLGPLVARRGHARVALPGGCAIGARPVDLHLQALSDLGANVTIDHGDIVAEAPKGLRGADITFARITVTGTENILMAAVLARGRTVLRNAAREPEVGDLARMLVKMGARIDGIDTDTLEIEGVNSLGGVEYTIIPDRIEAGTYVVAGALAGDGIRITECCPNHLPALLQILRQAGAVITVDDDAIVVAPLSQPLRAMSVTTAEYPGFATDLQAQLVTLLTQAQGTSTVTEAIFENRFQHVSELMRLGANIEVDGHTARITGPVDMQGTTVMASDLRASASLVLAGLVANGTTVIDRIYHLDRGYESMEVKLNALGASIERFNPGPFL